MSDLLYRKYQPIWIKLKAEGKVSLIAPRNTHSRIIKGVVQEKWEDTGYKLSIDPLTPYLSSSSSGAVLTFVLTKVSRDQPDRRIKRLSVKRLVRNL